MHSIQTKITALTLGAIILSLLLSAGVGIRSIIMVGDTDSTREIRLLSENRRQILNEYMDDIEQSVNMIAHFAVEQLDSVRLVQGRAIGYDGYLLRTEPVSEVSDRQRALNGYLYNYSNGIKNVFRTIANRTKGAIAYYYRLNPQLSRQEHGFLISRVGTPAFTEIPVTDLSAYGEDDLEHTGWYYIPLAAGRPSWIGPYYNDNLGTSMFSYVVPAYKAGTFLGVIGMDIDYSTIEEQIRDVSVYNTGFACLTDSEGDIIYHPTLEAGYNISTVDESLTAAIKNLENDSSSEIVEYTYEGIRKKAACTTLLNGLKLIVTAPVSEINSVTHTMTRKIILIGVALLAAAAFITTMISKRIVSPLRSLTEASKAMMRGNYDVKLDSNRSNDEVGVLTNAFQHLMDHLKLHINDLNSKAYKDALTSVRNKAGYELFVRKLDDQIRLKQDGRSPEFAVIMLDCNSLKEINDTFGHEKGDIYLQNSCHAICRTFVHSPVFRVGGDEFIVVVQGEDYENRDRLFSEFMERQTGNKAESSTPWNDLSLAAGMSVFDPAVDKKTEEVLSRADQLMYENKRLFHNSR